MSVRDPHRWDGEAPSARRFLALAEDGHPYHALIGAALDAAVRDARYGSASARAWLAGAEAQRWCELALPVRANVESLLKGAR